ncbi:MFS peptide transporter [Sphaerosporella brunnea]|uniref:MFS peptide transporter n=1 Tax=Sphaerosporella brunnea TaxID=1250544 RepID=A0A5J5F2N6_9PEZI|nr:MFS peptide transporter [Sphaerosporella brunnea]
MSNGHAFAIEFPSAKAKYGPSQPFSPRKHANHRRSLPLTPALRRLSVMATKNEDDPVYGTRSALSEVFNNQSAMHVGPRVAVRGKPIDPTEPTEDELATLPRVPGSLPFTAYTIAFIEMCERMSFCGTIAVFINFIQQPLPDNSPSGAGRDGQSGALGMGQGTAFGVATFDSLWVYTVPLLGGYLADTHWGRWKTVFIASILAIIGHGLLIVSSLPALLTAPKSSLAVLLIGIVIMGLGTGSIKANVSTLMAEQTAHHKPKIKVHKNGERVIVDPELTVSRSYLYLYLMLNIGAVTGSSGMVYAEKLVGFWLAYIIPLAFFFMSPWVLLWGRKRYVRSPPSGSVLSQTVKLLRLATKGKLSLNPVRTYKNLSHPDLLDRVKPSNIPVEQRPAWMTFPDSWVDEVKRGLKACQVLSWFPILWLGFNQMLHNLTSQAATLVTHGLPNDFYCNINPIVLVMIIPLFDQFLYPYLRRHNINFTPLKKIAAGFLAATLAVVWAMVLQLYIYRLSPCGRHANRCSKPAPISVWWQAGIYALTALSEVLAVTTGMEYCFAKAPTNMRSVVYSLYLLMTAIAGVVGIAFMPLSDDPMLVWNYAVIAVIMLGGFFGFCIHFRKQDRRESLDAAAVVQVDPASMADLQK